MPRSVFVRRFHKMQEKPGAAAKAPPKIQVVKFLSKPPRAYVMENGYVARGPIPTTHTALDFRALNFTAAATNHIRSSAFMLKHLTLSHVIIKCNQVHLGAVLWSLV